MTPSPSQSIPPLSSGEISTPEPVGATPQAEVAALARILEEEDGVFSLEYDNSRREKNTMRLDASTYPRALREARSFLEIGDDGRDAAGALWDIE